MVVVVAVAAVAAACCMQHATEIQVQRKAQRVIVSRQDSFHLLHKSSATGNVIVIVIIIFIVVILLLLLLLHFPFPFFILLLGFIRLLIILVLDAVIF